MKPANVIGSIYGKLTIIADLPRLKHNREVMVRCECGTEKGVILGSLRSGRTTSCGCQHKEVSTSHGQSRSGNKLYRVWASMKNRCADKTKKNYGSRNIQVCREWVDSFEVFHGWSISNGYIEGMSIDRVNNALGYSPDNCRWTTNTIQSRNRRSANGSSSQYIGVYRCNSRQIWVAQITVDKRKKTLGLFDTELAAAIARDQYIADNQLKDFQTNNVLTI